ncbi:MULTISPECIES: type III secretion chaperone SycN [Winslowiella]|uniref:type III secretion chaperone SycN n=1 Tax=Winslowiella TaxID=2997349 RepID=UPI0028BE6EA6|nr:type III secretion chaperone SycN [Winslowiella toletana]WNN43866.1 type III secretion chaperone SycN [Winslowiella toletana]
MELQTERRLEKFLQLADLTAQCIEERMEFSMPPYQLYIESLDEHILLTLGREVEPAYQIEVMKKLLTACHPSRTQGTPVRVWQLHGQQMLSCAPTKESDTTHWLMCMHTLRRLLETTAGGNR